MNNRIAMVAFAALAGPSAFAIFPDVAAPEFTFVGIVANNGSGTAITPFDVLTAKHVTGTSFFLPGFGTFNAIMRTEHPTADLALLRFSGPLPGFYAPLYGDQIGQNVTMVGFGDTGTLRANGTGYDSQPGFGTRRKGNQRVSTRQTVNLGGNITSSVSLLYDIDGNGVDTFQDGGPIAGEAGLNFGDSGGGWFRVISGQNRIVAVNSFIFNQPGTVTSTPYDFGDGGGAVDLNQYQAWIGQNTVPEPASMAALAVGLAVLARRRRK